MNIIAVSAGVLPDAAKDQVVADFREMAESVLWIYQVTHFVSEWWWALILVFLGVLVWLKTVDDALK